MFFLMKFHAHVLNLTWKFLELKLVHLQYRITWLYSLMKFLFCEWLQQNPFCYCPIVLFLFFSTCMIGSLCVHYKFSWTLHAFTIISLVEKIVLCFFRKKCIDITDIEMKLIIIAIAASLVCLQVMLITCILNASILWLVLHVISCDILNLFILIAESALALLRHRNYWISGYSSVSLIY